MRDLGGLCTSCGLTQKLSQVVATARTSNETTSPRDLLRDCFNSSKFSFFSISPAVGGLELKLHEEESKYSEAKPRCTCFPPSATSTQC